MLAPKFCLLRSELLLKQAIEVVFVLVVQILDVPCLIVEVLRAEVLVFASGMRHRLKGKFVFCLSFTLPQILAVSIFSWC